VQLSHAVSKIILAGEHAVVYGQPAIAIPVLSLKAYASVVDSEKFTISLEDLGEVLTKSTAHPFIDLAHATQAVLKRELPKVKITLKSEISIASGLGSGAALATALVRALLAYQHCEIPQSQLNDLIYESEKSFHGTPSGIDNTVIVYEKPIYFIKGLPPTLIDSAHQFSFLIADSGLSAPTKETVGDVRKLYEQHKRRIEPILHEIGSIVESVKESIQIGNAHRLGQLMNHNHNLLSDLTVSSDKLDDLVSAAQHSGALGAKLSGGGRGGNIIALVTSHTLSSVRQALIEAGATRVIQTMLNS